MRKLVVSGEDPPHPPPLLRQTWAEPSGREDDPTIRFDVDTQKNEAARRHLQRECLSPPVCCWNRGAGAPHRSTSAGTNGICEPGGSHGKWRPPRGAGGSTARGGFKDAEVFWLIGFLMQRWSSKSEKSRKNRPIYLCCCYFVLFCFLLK